MDDKERLQVEIDKILGEVIDAEGPEKGLEIIVAALESLIEELKKGGE